VAKRKGTKGQPTIYKTLHRKLKIKQPEHHYNPNLHQVTARSLNYEETLPRAIRKHDIENKKRMPLFDTDISL
jgi:hypothetical protein